MRTPFLRSLRVISAYTPLCGAILATTVASLAGPVGASDPQMDVACVDFDMQRIWLRTTTPEELTAPMTLGHVYVVDVSVETSDVLHDGTENQPGERVTVFIGSVEVGTTADIADDDPTIKTQVFPVDAALEVQEIRVVHAPIIAPDSVDVGLVCVSWLASAPTTTVASTTTVAPTTPVAGPTTAAPNTTLAEDSDPIIEDGTQLAFTGTGQILLMLAAAIALIDIGYLSWSATRSTRHD